MNIQKIIFIRRVIEEAEILFQFLSQLRNYIYTQIVIPRCTHRGSDRFLD